MGLLSPWLATSVAVAVLSLLRLGGCFVKWQDFIEVRLSFRTFSPQRERRKS